MEEKEYKKFIKRYDKFKKNNLPTYFWDDERLVQEYVYFYNGKSYLNEKECKNELDVYQDLVSALGDIAFTGFYYSFTDKHLVNRKNEKGKYIREFVVGHNHAHTFEGVVKSLYNSPESFQISKDEEQFYSQQELEYLRRVQKYLLFIGMKDINTTKVSMRRYQNKKHSKYENAFIYEFSDFALEKIIKGERDAKITEWYPEYSGPKVYKPKEYQALIVDKEDNFKLFIEFTYEEIKLFKDVKKICDIQNELKDDDKVILRHFKILEVFN